MTDARFVPYVQVDPSPLPEWPAGPWKREPNLRTGRHMGLVWCVMRHSGAGHLCGYVGMPKAHPGANSVDGFRQLKAHDFINYDCDSDCNDLWWIGFSCSGPTDLVPELLALGNAAIMEGKEYRNIVYAVDTCFSLIEQIHKVWPDYQHIVVPTEGGGEAE